MMIEEANKKELQDHQAASLREDLEKDPTGNIIDCESGRLALEKDNLRDPSRGDGRGECHIA